MKGLLTSVISLSLFCVPLFADKIITDPTLGYSIYLPTDTWKRVIKSSTHHQFYDTSFAYKSQVSIVRYAYSSSTYPSAESWTRANFIAYKLCVDYSFDPWAAMLYYDTAATVRQGISWATESYSTFFSVDTSLGTWSEFTRYTARNGYGWELYAIGDTADMRKNIGIYAGIIRLTTLPGDTNVGIIRRTAQAVTAPIIIGNSSILFDPLGRVRSPGSWRAAGPSGIFIRPEVRRITMVIK